MPSADRLKRWQSDISYPPPHRFNELDTKSDTYRSGLPILRLTFYIKLIESVKRICVALLLLLRLRLLFFLFLFVRL